MIAVLGVLALAVSSTPATAAARAADPEIVSVEFAAPTVDVSTGWAVATVSVHLRHPAGIEDTIAPAGSDNQGVVIARGAEAQPGRVGPLVDWIEWPRISRISGTATDGVWRGSIELSPGWHGTYTAEWMQVSGLDEVYYLKIPAGPAMTVTGGEAWALTNVPNPVKVVTGRERWRPQARITGTVTGRPVGGARVREGSLWDTTSALSRLTTSPGAAADASGLWTSPVTYDLTTQLAEGFFYAFGGRGARGWSLQGMGCANMSIKRQASATYADTTLSAGQPLTVTGNQWPAPSVARVDGGPINLERNLGAGGWQIVATTRARDTGRYTITWTPPGPGSYQVRVRLPGNGNPPCGNSLVGTTLAPTALSVTGSTR